MSGNIFLSRFFRRRRRRRRKKASCCTKRCGEGKKKMEIEAKKGFLPRVAFTAAFALGTRTVFSAPFSKISQPTYLHLRLHKTPRSSRISFSSAPVSSRSWGFRSAFDLRERIRHTHTLGSEKFPGRGILMKVQTLLLFLGGSAFSLELRRTSSAIAKRAGSGDSATKGR